MHIEIKNAEITSSIFLKWEYDQTEEGRKTKIKASADAPIHDDLKEAFNRLIPHFVLLTEMKKKPDVVKTIDLPEDMDEELLNKYKVRGFSVEEKNGITAVKLSGLKILTSGKSVSFDAPKTKRGNEDEGYEFFDELMECVEHLKEEVMEYMEGKCSEHVQQTMEFDGEGEDEAQDFVPEPVEEESEAA